MNYKTHNSGKNRTGNSYVIGRADNCIGNNECHSLTNIYKGNETQDEDGSGEYGKLKTKDIEEEYGKAKQSIKSRPKETKNKKKLSKN